MTLEGRRYIVTGAAGAVGRVVARHLLAIGAEPLLVDVSTTALKQVAESLPRAAYRPCDLCDIGATEAMVDWATGSGAPVDGLIQISGGFQFLPVLDTTVDDYNRLFDINMRTLYNSCKAILPHFTTRGSGTIIGIAAAPAIERGRAGMALYSAAKAAVATFLQGLAAEQAQTGIHVSVVYPMNAIDTPANREAMPNEDPNSWIAPEALAKTIEFALTPLMGGRLVELPVYPE